MKQPRAPSIPCPVAGCRSAFDSSLFLNRHLHRKHPKIAAAEHSPRQATIPQVMAHPTAQKRHYSETEPYPTETSGLSPSTLNTGRRATNRVATPIVSDSESSESETEYNFSRIPADDDHQDQQASPPRRDDVDMLADSPTILQRISQLRAMCAGDSEPAEALDPVFILSMNSWLRDHLQIIAGIVFVKLEVLLNSTTWLWYASTDLGSVAGKFSTSNSSKDSKAAVLRWADDLLFNDQARQNLSFFIRYQTDGFRKLLDFVQNVVQVSFPAASLPADIANRLRSGFGNVPPFRQRALRHSLTLTSFVNRDHAMKKLFQDGFMAQLRQLSVADASKRCRLSATSGAPGAGKSYFLDKLASSSEVAEYARVHLQQKTLTWLGVELQAADLFAEGNVLTLNITFNSDTQVDTDTFIESRLSFGQRAVLRLLFNYFGPSALGLESTRFKSFVSSCLQSSDFDSPSTDLIWCFELILEHFFQTHPDAQVVDKPFVVIFGIDELVLSAQDKQKSEQMEFFQNAVSVIGALMDRVWDVPNSKSTFVIMPVVSSLSMVIVSESVTHSKRDINWIPLGPLTDIYHEVFRVIFRKQIGDDPKLKDAAAAVRYGCLYLGQHGRLVQQFTDLASSPEYRSKLETDGFDACASIIAALASSGKFAKYVVHANLPRDVVACAVFGEVMSPDSKPAGCKLSVDQLVSQGVYLRATVVDEDEENVIPTMSLFQINRWCLRRRKRENDLFCQTLLKVTSIPSSLNWQSLENLHFAMDFLIRSDTTNRDSLSSLYKLPFAFSSPIRSCMEVLAERFDLSDLSSYIISPDHPKLAFERKVPTSPGQSEEGFALFPHLDVGPVPSGSVSDSLGDWDVRVRLMFRNQQAFDIISDQTFISQNGARCVIRDYIQIKWSEIAEMPESELQDFVNFVKSLMVGLTDLSAHHRFVFVTTRTITPLQKRNAHNNFRSIVPCTHDPKPTYGYSNCCLCCRPLNNAAFGLKSSPYRAAYPALKNCSLLIFGREDLIALYGPTMSMHSVFLGPEFLQDVKLATAVPDHEDEVE